MTTEPSVFNAPKARWFEYISVTPEVKELDTESLFPPLLLSPQVTTEPSLFRAEKAPSSVENIWVTPEVKEEATEELSPPKLLFPQVTTEPSVFKAAKADFVCGHW